MDTLTIRNGTYRPDGTIDRLPDGTAHVCDMERGLCLQYYEDRVLANRVAYGVTHHEGYRLTGPWFSYEEARHLQQRLLMLPIDWTQGRDVLDQPTMARAEAQALIRYWRLTRAISTEERP